MSDETLRRVLSAETAAGAPIGHEHFPTRDVEELVERGYLDRVGAARVTVTDWGRSRLGVDPLPDRPDESPLKKILRAVYDAEHVGNPSTVVTVANWLGKDVPGTSTTVFGALNSGFLSQTDDGRLSLTDAGRAELGAPQDG